MLSCVVDSRADLITLVSTVWPLCCSTLFVAYMVVDVASSASNDLQCCLRSSKPLTNYTVCQKLHRCADLTSRFYSGPVLLAYLFCAFYMFKVS